MNNSVDPSSLPASVHIDLEKFSMNPHTVHTLRHVSDLSAQFADKVAVDHLIKNGDPLVYEIYHNAFVTPVSDLAMGMSVIYPGVVGDEYYMTKGHMHERNDQAEIYYCVKGQGMLLMDDMAGDFQPFEFNKGVAVHIPPQYAHRVVNTGSDIFIFVSVFHVKAGHAYAQVTERGFSNLAVEKNGKPVLRPNPLH